MLEELREASGLSLGDVSRTLGGEVSDRALKGWWKGTAAPADDEVFREVLGCLHNAWFQQLLRESTGEGENGASDYKEPSEDEWMSALLAARCYSAASRGRSDGSRCQDPSHRFIRRHLSHLRVRGDLGRHDERAAMDAFVQASGPEAPSYLCWHAELPVGKTVLLADYASRPPERPVDLLSFVVSEAEETNNLAAFTAEMTRQLRAFFNHYQGRVLAQEPRTVREWVRLFKEAAALSAKQGRRLLLVVDGLDEDAAWAGDDRARSTGSIAAMLPPAPPANLRIIVSVRRTTSLPDDIPADHPLRLRTCLRQLGPGQRAAQVEEACQVAAVRLRESEPGATIAALLAVAGGGLRVSDLAQLAGTPVDQIERLLRGPAGRCIVHDDLAADTYVLSHPAIVCSVRSELGAAGVTRYADRLRAWNASWRDAGWPEETPRYALEGCLRLLDDTDQRTEYILDTHRQARFAAVAGPEVAVAQLDALEAETRKSATGVPGPERLGAAARLAASRAFLSAKSRHVPHEAAALLVRLDDVDRARAFACAGTDPLTTATALARIAAKARRAKVTGAAQIAKEAVWWMARAERIFPLPVEVAAHHAEIAAAARDLYAYNEQEAARELLEAVIATGAADVETLMTAVGMLPVAGDSGWVAALEARADDLSMGGARAKAAAVDIWATIAGRFPSRRRRFRESATRLCSDLDASDGLAAANIRALAASGLSRVNYPAPARVLLNQAMATVSAALADPDELSLDDRAHLRRELSTTLNHIAEAVRDAGSARRDPKSVGDLIDTHRETFRAGVLGDDLAERAAATLGLPPPPGAPRVPEADPAAADGSASPHLALFRRAERLLGEGNVVLAREQVWEAVRRSPVRAVPSAPGGGWLPALVQALGATGEFGWAERLLPSADEPESRSRRLAALSLGCAQGCHDGPAGRYAREAARHAAEVPDPVLLGEVAQALAHAGLVGEAVELAARTDSDARAARRNRPQRLQSLTAVAAGLAQRAPEAAGHVEEAVALFRRRIGNGSPYVPLPQLASLLLAFPDVRLPKAYLRDALTEAVGALHTKEIGLWRPSTAAVAGLLEQLGCPPYQEGTAGVADAVYALRGTQPPNQVPYAELAVLKAVAGDTAAALAVAAAAVTRKGQVVARCAVAGYLAGAPAALAVDHAAGDGTVRLCLALAHAAGDGTAPDSSTARVVVEGLLADGAWESVVPLLPRLAPAALVPLAKSVLAHR